MVAMYESILIFKVLQLLQKTQECHPTLYSLKNITWECCFNLTTKSPSDLSTLCPECLLTIVADLRLFMQIGVTFSPLENDTQFAMCST